MASNFFQVGIMALFPLILKAVEELLDAGVDGQDVVADNNLMAVVQMGLCAFGRAHLSTA